VRRKGTNSLQVPSWKFLLTFQSRWEKEKNRKGFGVGELSSIGENAFSFFFSFFKG
jgi:hypothetical protein